MNDGRGLLRYGGSFGTNSAWFMRRRSYQVRMLIRPIDFGNASTTTQTVYTDFAFNIPYSNIPLPNLLMAPPLPPVPSGY